MVLRVLLIGSDSTFGQELRQHLEGMSQLLILDGMRTLSGSVGSVGRQKPDVVMVEVPEGDSAGQTCDGIAQLLDAHPDVSVVSVGPGNSAELVIRAIRAGAVEFLKRPVASSDLALAIEKIRRIRRVPAPAQGKAGQVVSVYATKGGLGVTSLATNMAVCLAQKTPDRVLLVDLDVCQGSVTAFLNLKPTYSVQDMFGRPDRVDEAYLRGLVLRHASGLHVLPAPGALEQARFSSDQVSAGLEVIRAHFAHVVLDLPRDVGPGTIAALEQSDQILYVVGLNVPALRASANGIATLRSLGIDMRKVRVIVNRADARDEVTVKQAHEVLALPIFWRAPNDYPTVVSSINEGTPFVLASPKTEIAKSMQKLSEVVGGGIGRQGESPSWLPSFARRVFTYAS
jgi:pilus assembly protein CpaE